MDSGIAFECWLFFFKQLYRLNLLEDLTIKGEVGVL